ncbi:glycosyltransferase family 9 protein [Salinisphaera aquimarina]|uniref:Glycosyltransferase family 9 protein n=1 Tax=Salinisphaera aquimarina TaxID=2094031 RepID=A0ABV7EQ42_9GAMM
MGRQNTAVNATGWHAVIKRWRRNNRGRLNRLLTRLLGTAAPRRRALAPDTRRILVVRLNKRLGNILFLTPLLRTLAASLPTASIDVLIQDVKQKALLESLPGVGRVWVQEKTLTKLFGLARQLRRQHYDLAIDPSGNSTSNRLAMVLSGARQRMGFAGDTQWLRLSHAAPRPRSRHQAEQAVELFAESVDTLALECFDTLAVFPAAAAQAQARQHWDAAFGDADVRRPVIGFFAHATGNKQLPAAWWDDWCRALATRLPGATLVQIRPPGQPANLLEDTVGVSIAELDVLAALMTRMDVFVAADSGPMHLAAAAGIPVVGLFQSTDPAAYAPLGRGCISLSGDTLTGTQAALAVARIAASAQRGDTAREG